MIDLDQDSLYNLVPKDTIKNLDFRADLIEKAEEDDGFRRDLWIASSRDILFWFNTFAWTYDPRKIHIDPVSPFITYGFQDSAICVIDGAIGIEDVHIDKSRDMGASWLCLSVIAHRFLFKSMESYMFVSRVADLVDASGDPDSLFWKFDFLIKHLPQWMVPSMKRIEMHVENQENGCVIDGQATTGDVGVGGRRTAVLLDEFAKVKEGYEVLKATRDNTKCRIFNSTPMGAAGAFYDMKLQIEKSGVGKRIRMHWSEHPEKAAGLYIDTEGKMRSPWYDQESRRAAHPAEIARELDIDYQGSAFQFFDQTILDRHEIEFCFEPYRVGYLEFDRETYQPIAWVNKPNGHTRLWTHPDSKYRLPKHPYCAGADIAAGSRDVHGTGASNSVMSILDQQTAEFVAEVVIHGMDPTEFAKICVAMCKWFKGDDFEGAFFIWEANGPGRLFGDKVIEYGYRNIWFKTNEAELGAKPSDTPGWFSTPTNKMAMLGEYARALRSGEVINRSKPAIRECKDYIYLPSGQIAHSRSVNPFDPSEARMNHGDRVIANALAWKVAKRAYVVRKEEDTVPEGSLMQRRSVAEERRRKADMW